MTLNSTIMNAMVISNETAVRMSVIASRIGSELMAGAKAIMIEPIKSTPTPAPKSPQPAW